MTSTVIFSAKYIAWAGLTALPGPSKYRMIMKFVFNSLFLKAFAVVLAFASLCSCSIKEVRDNCPCYLHVSIKDKQPVTGNVGYLGWTDELMFNESVNMVGHVPYWIHPVKKCELKFASYCGASFAMVGGHDISVPYGRECDSLYAYHSVVDATGEDAYEEVLFHKQFCTVFLDVRKTAAQLQEFKFEVDGGTDGFDLFTFSPVSGKFHCEPVAKPGEKIVSFRIPRQADSSLKMKVTRSVTGFDDVVMGDFPLGEYIVKQGYNWESEELDDVYVVIDFILGHIIVSVAGWEEGAYFSFVEQ